MYRRVGKLDLKTLCRRTSGIHNYKSCSVIINRHYQCGEQGVYGFRSKQTVPFKCELNLLCYLFINLHLLLLLPQMEFSRTRFLTNRMPSMHTYVECDHRKVTELVNVNLDSAAFVDALIIDKSTPLKSTQLSGVIYSAHRKLIRTNKVIAFEVVPHTLNDLISTAAKSGNNTNDFCFLLNSCPSRTHTHSPLDFDLFFLCCLFCSLFTFAVADDVVRIRQQQSNFVRWVDAYREHSHRMARTNPIEIHTIERFVQFT